MARPSDHDLDLEIATMLRWGVSIAACVVLAGGFLYLLRAAHTRPDYTHFHPETSRFYSVAATLHSATHLDPMGILQAGLLLLIATPIARVGLCVIGFARQHSRLYVAISTTVLLILLYSLVQRT